MRVTNRVPETDVGGPECLHPRIDTEREDVDRCRQKHPPRIGRADASLAHSRCSCLLATSNIEGGLSPFPNSSPSNVRADPTAVAGLHLRNRASDKPLEHRLVEVGLLAVSLLLLTGSGGDVAVDACVSWLGLVLCHRDHPCSPVCSPQPKEILGAQRQ